MAAVSITKTFGALLLGGLFASMLSGFVITQVVVYFKLYPSDQTRLKALVLTVWLLDTCHTTCIWLSLWSYFIDNFGNLANINNIHWSLALSVLFPAFLTFLVHNFLAQRIFMLSKRNYILTIPIVVLAILRLVSACVTTSFMLHLKTFTTFKDDVRFIFTTGLALSTAIDVIITASLFILLKSSRTGAATLDAVVDALIRYSFETSTLTCAGTIASMLCWIIIPNNLIFMGLHFVIGKLYANSLLVTLNTRESIRRARSQDHGLRINIMKERKSHKSHDSGENTLHSTYASPVDKLKDDDEKGLHSTYASPVDKLKDEDEKGVEVVVERSIQMEQP